MALGFKKFALAIGFLSFSYCWGMDSKIDDFEVFSLDKIDKTKIPVITLKSIMDLGKVDLELELDKIDKTKIPAITLKPMDYGKVCLELEIEENKHSLTLDQKEEVDKTIFPEGYRDLFFDTKGFSWLIPSQNLDINFTWTHICDFDDKKIEPITIYVKVSNLNYDQTNNIIFSFAGDQSIRRCKVQTGKLFNFNYLKLVGVSLENSYGHKNSRINVLECEKCDRFIGGKLSVLNHLIGVKPANKRLLSHREELPKLSSRFDHIFDYMQALPLSDRKKAFEGIRRGKELGNLFAREFLYELQTPRTPSDYPDHPSFIWLR